jgi:hypothetical protein
VNEVVLDGVARPHDLGVLEAGDAVHQPLLHVERKGRRDAVGVDLLRLESVRLEDHLVPLTIGEANDLVLDGRTVANPGGVDDAGIERRAVEVVADEGVRGRRRPRHVAGDLRQRQPRGRPVKRPRPLVAPGGFEMLPDDGRAAQTRRGAGLQSPEREPERAQRVRQIDGRELAGATGTLSMQPHVDEAAQEGPRGDDHRQGTIAGAVLPFDTHDPSTLDEQARDVRLAHVEPGLGLHRLLHGRAIAGAIALRARGADGRTA